MTKTVLLFTVVVLGILLELGTSSGQSSGELPLRMNPQRLAERIEEPERSLYEDAADLMHKQQEKTLEDMDSRAENWQEEFLVGVAFALEEYWMRELSYPQDWEQFESSGYLLEGWKEAGYAISGYDEFHYEDGNRQLVYIPLPIGLAELKRVPGMHCAFSRRCFYAYSLLIPEQAASIWMEPSSMHTRWIDPFLCRGFREVMHVNKNEPGMSGCSLCN